MFAAADLGTMRNPHAAVARARKLLTALSRRVRLQAC